MQWVQYDSESRQIAAYELLKSVRLDHLSEEFLSSLLEDEKYESVLPIKFLKCVTSVLRQRSDHGWHKKSHESSPALVQQPRLSYIMNKLLIIGGTCDSENARACMYWNRNEEYWFNFTELPNYYTNCYEWSVCAGDGRTIFVSGGYHKDNESGLHQGSSQVWMWHNNGWKALPTMIQGRWAHGFVYADKKLFVFGGKARKQNDHIQCLKSNEFLDLKSLEQGLDTESFLTSHKWKKARNMKFCFHSPLLSILGDYIYLLGMAVRGNNIFRQEIYRFNISKHTMTKLSDIPFSLWGGVATTVADNIFAFGIKHQTMCMRYTPSTDTWCELSPSGAIADNRPLPLYIQDRISPLAVVDGKIVLAKRMHNTREDTLIVDEYDVEENTWNKSNFAPPPALYLKGVSLVCADLNI